MAYLVIAVVFVGAVGLLNLLLTVAVIRRLRQHSAKLAGAGTAPAGGPGTLPVGATVAGFASTTVDGNRITGASFAAPTVVALFSTECRACHDQIAHLTTLLDRNAYPRSQALGVVVGDPVSARPFVQALRDRVELVVEPVGGPLSAAFSANAFPAFYLVDDVGTVTASAATASELAEAAEAMTAGGSGSMRSPAAVGGPAA